MPWHSDLYAALIRTLQQADPKAIGLVASFNREWPDEQRIPGKKLFVIRPYPKPKTVDPSCAAKNHRLAHLTR